jgi:hypothetical protein
MDQTAAPSAALTLVTTTTTGTVTTTKKDVVKGAVSQYAGCYVVFSLDSTATKLAEGKAYQFVLSGVPTAWNSVLGAQMNLGSLVLSVGKSATGGFGYSSAQLFPALASQAPATGLNLLEFSSNNVAVSRGTYTRNAVCIQPGTGNFKSVVEAKTTSTAFKTNPAVLSAKMGSAKACADLGTASTTQMSTHNLYWTVTNGTKTYTSLPTMMATVNGNTATVTVPAAVTCSLGGSSVPIVVTSTAAPYADIKVSLKTSIAADEAKTDNSVGITPNAGEVVTLNTATASGVLGFKCAKEVKGKELKYDLAGTDKAQFTLSATLVTVTAAAAGTKPTKPAMTLTMTADKSEAASVQLVGTCPGMGNAWINMQPRAFASKPLASSADVTAAMLKFTAGAEGNHARDQWCSSPVAKKDEKTTCSFASASKGEYSAFLYCETIEGWFFASTAGVNVTAPDNGGKPVTLSLTYKKAIDVVAQNSVVLSICGKLAESMAVPYSRVTDAYGGYFGAPSASLPATAAAATTTTAATNTTANKTMRMLNTTNATNATAAPKKTQWVLNLFVQPDPFAKKADNDATIKAATGTAALAAIDGVTKATYGAMTAKAVAVTEAKVSWVKKPTATGGAKQIVIGGSTDVAGYVYCAVSKTANARRRMLNTTNASNTTTAAKPATAAATVVDLRSAGTAATYNIQRAQTKATALTFSLTFTGLGEGATHGWLCEATSLSPTNPQFSTGLTKGNAQTTAAPVVPAGDSALWSSLFAAILMIAAVFFY